MAQTSAPIGERGAVASKSMTRRVLVVAYYFPPMGLSGVQRIAKFVKYLPRHGWQPTVLTVEPRGYFAYDDTLLQEVRDAGVSVVRTPSWDPTRLFRGQHTVSLPQETVRQRLASLSQWVFVPDNKIGWWWPALREGLRLHEAAPFDAVLSTAPPYTAHLIGAAFERLTGCPLVLDFRDDWLGNPRHLYPTRLHRQAHAFLERWVLRRSRRVLTINPYIQQRLQQSANHLVPSPSIRVVPQGYDPSDFLRASRPAPRDDTERFELLYTGVFYDVQRPDTLLRGIAQFVQRRPEARTHLRARFIGLTPPSMAELVAHLGLSPIVETTGYLDHQRTVRAQLQADVLWLTIGHRPGAACISTGKLYEYIGASKPILGLVPPGDAADTLRAYGASQIVDPDDVDGCSRAVERWYDAWRNNTLPRPERAIVERYDRVRLAGVLASHLSAAADANA